LFEDKALADESVNAVEKQLHTDSYEIERQTSLGDGKNPVSYVEAVPSREVR